MQNSDNRKFLPLHPPLFSPLYHTPPFLFLPPLSLHPTFPFLTSSSSIPSLLSLCLLSSKASMLSNALYYLPQKASTSFLLKPLAPFPLKPQPHSPISLFFLKLSSIPIAPIIPIIPKTPMPPKIPKIPMPHIASSAKKESGNSLPDSFLSNLNLFSHKPHH